MEEKINALLRRFPFIKKIIKRVYQVIMVIKYKTKGKIINFEPLKLEEGKNYFFGYYDKTPWSYDDKQMIFMRTNATCKKVENTERAEIILYNLTTQKEEVIGNTNSWNVQQGCMLQWLDKNSIIYNKYITDKYKAVIYNTISKEEKIIDYPIYSVSSNRKFAINLNFNRLHFLRPGYGYCNQEKQYKANENMDSFAINYVDLQKNQAHGILTYNDIIAFKENNTMKNAIHKVNHIMISPDSQRFMFLHRWFKNGRKYTRLLTADVNGKNIYELLNEGMVSHCYWKNEKEIIAFAHTKIYGNSYVLLKDKSQTKKKLWDELKRDGHPSYNKNNKLYTTDTYPDKCRMSHLYIMNEKNVKEIGSIYNSFYFDNLNRCDLHPRWNRSGTKICIDGAPQKNRKIFIVEVPIIKK